MWKQSKHQVKSTVDGSNSPGLCTWNFLHLKLNVALCRQNHTSSVDYLCLLPRKLQDRLTQGQMLQYWHLGCAHNSAQALTVLVDTAFLGADGDSCRQSGECTTTCPAHAHVAVRVAMGSLLGKGALAFGVQIKPGPLLEVA